MSLPFQAPIRRLLNRADRTVRPFGLFFVRPIHVGQIHEYILSGQVLRPLAVKICRRLRTHGFGRSEGFEVKSYLDRDVAIDLPALEPGAYTIALCPPPFCGGCGIQLSHSTLCDGCDVGRLLERAARPNDLGCAFRIQNRKFLPPPDGVFRPE